ncbi:hypothetical protein Q5P01_000414 [Channa striata]|uniref:Ig-like domain-containing protein n=1 Tax=Channa striata TaxID=64152 RepID=A0AA88IDL2_CHASR|nr:hypothetical protein Q5P01_000414 [Channa striata]
MVLFLILMSHFTVSGQHVYITVRDGDDVTLPCENVTEGQDKCDGTDWTFNQPQHETAELVKSGQIDKTHISKSKSDRLSVTEKCSLVIKKVTDKDFGLYSCRQDGQDTLWLICLLLPVITEHKDNNQVTLSCSVWTHDPCRHTVKWLFKDQVMVKDHGSLKISQSDCSARVTVEETHFVHSNYDLLKCNVTDPKTRKVQQFSFRRQSSAWLRFTCVSVALTTLTVTVVLVNSWKRKEGENSKYCRFNYYKIYCAWSDLGILIKK